MAKIRGLFRTSQSTSDGGVDGTAKDPFDRVPPLRGTVSMTAFWDVPIESRLDVRLKRYLEPPKGRKLQFDRRTERLQRAMGLGAYQEGYRSSLFISEGFASDPNDPTFGETDNHARNAHGEEDPNDPEIAARNADGSPSDFQGWEVHPDLMLVPADGDTGGRERKEYEGCDVFSSPSSARLASASERRKQALLARKLAAGLGQSDLTLVNSKKSLALTSMANLAPGTSSVPSNVYSVEQVVREAEDPDLMISLLLFGPSRPPRPLYVYRDPRGRGQMGKHSSSPSIPFSLVVQVVRASNVPLRSATFRSSGMAGVGASSSSSSAMLCACVAEIGLQGHTACTRPAAMTLPASVNPSWDQVLSLPVNAPGGQYDPSSLLSMKEDISVTLFDLVIVAGEETTASATTTSSGFIGLRAEKRFLGKVVIPFAQLAEKGVIDESFEVDVPLLQFEYETLLPAEPTSIHLYLTLDPCLPLSATAIAPSSRLALALGLQSASGFGFGQSAGTGISASKSSLSMLGEMNVDISPQLGFLGGVSLSTPAFGDIPNDYVDDGIGPGSALSTRNATRSTRTLDTALSDALSPALQWVLHWTRGICVRMPGHLRLNATTIVPDISMRPILITRFLTPQMPPKSCAHNSAAFVRFVAQIPSLRRQHVHAAAARQLRESVETRDERELQTAQMALENSRNKGTKTSVYGTSLINLTTELSDLNISLVDQTKALQPIDFSSCT